MRLPEFLASPSGRVYTGTTAFAALAAALLGLAGPSAPTAALPLITLVCMLGGFLSVGLAIDRHPLAAILLIFILPFEAAPYFVGLHYITTAGPFPIFLLSAVGLAAAATSITGGRLPRRTRALLRPHLGPRLGSSH